ncbi:hypothetical protein KP509_09G088000 [Ceratopteris richardii]|uniref:Uncharacterized protein n=1 Tax=Ceratopteris richardii TaxID=49495 RepID=A0A8T2UCJ9_CERRI|nr:hypothetical protein KP509_09G088000 [Ceratopteris richardii]
MMRISHARVVLGVSGDASLSQITEAYQCLKTAKGSGPIFKDAAYTTGVSVARGSRRMQFSAVAVPFMFIIMGTIGLGLAQARRAYKENQKHSSSHNPFLP